MMEIAVSPCLADIWKSSFDPLLAQRDYLGYKHIDTHSRSWVPVTGQCVNSEDQSRVSQHLPRHRSVIPSFTQMGLKFAVMCRNAVGGTIWVSLAGRPRQKYHSVIHDNRYHVVLGACVGFSLQTVCLYRVTITCCACIRSTDMYNRFGTLMKMALNFH